jgi:iron complex transport system substrate-binding protein
VAQLPVLTEPKLDPGSTSRQIDDRVKKIVRDGLSVYRVDAARLREIQPTLSLTQDQCEVCAASLKDVEDALRTWLGARPRIVSLDPQGLDDVWSDIRRVAEALGEPQRGRALTASLGARIRAIAERTGRISERPGVACIEWIDPLMAAGNWIPELVKLAGGRNLFGEPGEHSAWLRWDELRAADPDVVLVFPCGFDLARTRAELSPLQTQPGWDRLRAVREGRVLLADASQYFNRPGPRLVESLEILVEVLHPEHFAPRHRDVAWQPL